TFYPAGTTVYPAGTQYEYRSGYAVPNGERRMDRRDADRSETERRNSDRSSDTERRTPDTDRGTNPANLDRAPAATPPSPPPATPRPPPAPPDKPGAPRDKPPPGARAAAPAPTIARLPADAQLRIDDQPTRSTSEQRTFLSPPLPAGREFVYTLQADAVRN